MSIEVLNESGEGEINEEMLVDVCSFALAAMDVHPETEATITLVDEPTMADLHVRWMDLEGPTDVMSFPMDELTPGGGRPDAAEPGPAMLGDIILCPAFDRRQAAVAGHDLGHELALLTVHGVLHLLGYDHVAPEDEREMFSLQNEILADWYDSLAARGVAYQPKPTGAQAFPSAADRDELDRRMKET
ncbi:rRNA maturation RNase YbeY [Corynebacterium liangguodongii]|uniref:Endoribonuclease YbeY n=1 Tax=Corynebacterium liangguodongii TaxID=2079535 RepID=A0A2S0WFD2_9CORY|nr:rRNA maturation RNase YbeY [Corynebacterium liangguodongii]AWB84466.1 rRNA maturation RNase YbeY [Corynebacterium liangguodongii]PWB98603.1 rRNA maturation RNase YbeY [Corynebacterium liangguodongii]